MSMHRRGKLKDQLPKKTQDEKQAYQPLASIISGALGRCLLVPVLGLVSLAIE